MRLSSSRSLRFLPLLSLLFACALVGSTQAFQKPGGRDSGTPSPSPTPVRRINNTATSSTPTSVNKSREKTNKSPVRLASMSIIAPPGCRIWLDESEVDTTQPAGGVLLVGGIKAKISYAMSTGTLTLEGLEPKTYTLRAHKSDFQDYVKPVTLYLDQQNVFAIDLTPIPGKLTVSPSITGADVEIINLETNMSVGHYSERLDKFELNPGTYRVVTSKGGYKSAAREVKVDPGESVYLEPVLESLPRPAATPRPPAFVAPMSFDVQRQDKYFILRLQGSSGDSGVNVGSINVSLAGPDKNYVTGNLNGLPCKVEFIRLENVAEASIVEAPGPSNKWASIIVRVRPKDEKRRPISFAINWSSLQATTPVPAAHEANVFVPAEAVRKVQPEYPLAARTSAMSATVLVLVVIDSSGAVISAKATDGPFAFRRVSEEAARKWKFRPATRNAQPVESEMTVQFRFEP